MGTGNINLFCLKIKEYVKTGTQVPQPLLSHDE